MNGSGFTLRKDKTGTILLYQRDNKGNEELVLRGDFNKDSEGLDPVIHSPTLRLNADLGNFTEKQLEQIALCEKFREEAGSVNSYLLKVDPVVAVIGEKVFVDEFMDVYGGLLRLVPVVVGKKDDISMELKDGKKVVISCISPLPLDERLCNLCRSCVSVCEEKAISSKPAIDLERCNLCGRCKRYCDTGAIDLHRMEEKVIEADYVVALSRDFKTSADLGPELKGRLFFKDNLSGLFSRIGSFQIEECIVHNVEYCSFDPRLGTGCKRCVSFCPKEAITTGVKGIYINHLSCIECGACVAACPTGAMEYARFTCENFMEYFRRLHLPQGMRVVVGKENELRDFWWNSSESRYDNVFFISYPQPLCLSSLELLSLLATGILQIAILFEGALKQTHPFNQEVVFANSVMGQLFPSREKPVLLLSPSELDSFLKKERAVPSIQSEGLMEEAISSYKLKGKRQGLNRVLKALYEEMGEPTASFFIEGTSFGNVTVNERCSLCLSCLNVCYQEALSAKDSDRLELILNRGSCINCKACSSICPEGAVEVTSGLRLDSSFFSESVVAQDERLRCKRCGKVFGNKKSHRRALRILREANRYDEKIMDVLSLCDECRAIAMLEDVIKG